MVNEPAVLAALLAKLISQFSEVNHVVRY